MWDELLSYWVCNYLSTLGEWVCGVGVGGSLEQSILSTEFEYHIGCPDWGEPHCHLLRLRDSRLSMLHLDWGDILPIVVNIAKNHLCIAVWHFDQKESTSIKFSPQLTASTRRRADLNYLEYDFSLQYHIVYRGLKIYNIVIKIVFEIYHYIYFSPPPTPHPTSSKKKEGGEPIIPIS